MSRPCARGARAPSRPARARPRACRPPRSSCGTPRRPSPRPRRAPCGSTPSACAGSTRAAGARRPACTSSRIFARTCSSASRSRCSSERLLEALGDVERLQQLDLVSQAQVRRVAGGVGQRARPGDRAQERADARVGAAQVEDLLDHRAVLALRASRICSSVGSGSSWTVTSTRSVPVESVLAAPGTPRATPSTVTAVPPPGMRMRSTTSATVPTRGELAVGAGHQQDALLVPGLDGDGRRHAREEDRVVEGDENQVFHGSPLSSSSPCQCIEN